MAAYHPHPVVIPTPPATPTATATGSAAVAKTPDHTPTAHAGSAGAAALDAKTNLYGAVATSGAAAVVVPRADLRIALICQSNLNRSMEAHFMLSKKGFAVCSFGAGTKVRLPGEAQNKPNIYDFGTPYDAIYNDLKTKNHARYTKTGMLAMVDRNRRIKIAPERWQDTQQFFDLIICYEKRVYDTVCTDIESRSTARSASGAAASGGGGGLQRPVHVINLETNDNHTEAHNGALLTVQLVNRITTAADWEDEITPILDSYEKKNKKSVLHSVLFY